VSKHRVNQKKWVLTLKVLVHTLCIFLLSNLYYQAINDHLGADPVEEVIHFTGIGAFNLLIISLLISPMAKFFKQGWLMQFRRLIGLYCFTYASLHILSFLAFEVQFDWQLFVSEIIERPYITIGMLAFCILLLLAITSIAIIKRKMGKSWQKLHHWVYLVLVLVAVHFYWSVKSDIVEPSFYILVSLLLLLLRKEKILQRLK